MRSRRLAPSEPTDARDPAARATPEPPEEVPNLVATLRNADIAADPEAWEPEPVVARREAAQQIADGGLYQPEFTLPPRRRPS